MNFYPVTLMRWTRWAGCRDLCSNLRNAGTSATAMIDYAFGEFVNSAAMPNVTVPNIDFLHLQSL